MALIEHDLFRGRIDKVQMAIDRLKLFEPAEGYYLAYSGGKDSDTILALAKMAGVKFDAHYNLTTVDPPELVWHVKKHPEVAINYPKETMWQLIVRKRMPPTRLVRYCCEVFKEGHGGGRLVLTGIRAEESKKRAGRKMVEACLRDKTIKFLHPVIDWTSKDVWQFLKENQIRYCKLYDEGWKRLGCILCPYSNQKKEAARWPKIANAYRRAIIKAWEKRCSDIGNDGAFSSGEELWNWWITGRGRKQMSDNHGLFT